MSRPWKTTCHCGSQGSTVHVAFSSPGPLHKVRLVGGQTVDVAVSFETDQLKKQKECGDATSDAAICM